MIKSVLNRLVNRLLTPPVPVVKYYGQYIELEPGTHVLFDNVELIKFDDTKAVCVETGRVIPFAPYLLVEVKLTP